MSAPDWSWQTQAACRGEDLTLFFGIDGERGDAKVRREAVAKSICAECPVLQRCRETAFVLKLDSGVWGGLGEDERASERRRRQRRNAPMSAVATPDNSLRHETEAVAS